MHSAPVRYSRAAATRRVSRRGRAGWREPRRADTVADEPTADDGRHELDDAVVRRSLTIRDNPMSMKFLSGLQDLLGLYDSAGSPSSPSSPIPPSNGLFPAQKEQKPKKSAQEINDRNDDESPVNKCSHGRRVAFTEGLVTGFSEPPSCPFETQPLTVREDDDEAPQTSSPRTLGPPDPGSILSKYRQVCKRDRLDPSAAVERQIGYMHHSLGVRQESLSLKGERVSYHLMEAMEEVFRAAQFDSLDFEYTFLDDDALVSLSEMLEYYDSTHKLNLSFNRQISNRGWTALFKAVKNAHSLQVLNLRYTSVERGFSSLCRCLRLQPPPSLVCLHLENVAIAGKNLLLLACALKTNNTLKELYLGENCLQPTDGVHLHQLIVSNTTLQMLDLRNNELGDGGVRHLCDALRQSDVRSRSSLSALVLWNNRITAASMDTLAMVLKENQHVETLNIGSNPLGVAGLAHLKTALASSNNLHRLGLQNTKMDCEASIILAECLADNTAMVRVDLRDNPGIGSAGLLALHSAMKMNSSITLLNLDQSCANVTSEKVRPYQEELRRLFDEIRRLCEQNKQAALDRIEARADDPDMVIVTEKDVQDAGCPSAVVDSPSSSSSSSIPLATPLFQGKEKTSKRFTRSSSLTCTETVQDINERIREMTGSTHSLDDTNTESATTIKRQTTTTYEPLGKAAWGSLPAIPQVASSSSSASSDIPATSGAPAVRKMRRFSVSPSSSTFDVSATPTTSLQPLRPSSLAIGIPSAFSSPAGPSSAPVCSSLPSTLSFWPEQSERRFSPVAEHPSSSYSFDPVEGSSRSTVDIEWAELERLRTDRMRQKDVHAVVTDLVNYVVYEESSVVERKASILLGSAPSESQLRAELSSAGCTPNTPLTPSKMFDIHEDMTSPGPEDESQTVRDVVRQLVRDVLKAEKEQLRSTLEQRRRHRNNQPPGTPV